MHSRGGVCQCAEAAECGASATVPPTLEQFVRQLAESGLMSQAEISSFHEGLAPEKRPASADALARQLVLQPTGG